ncbi:hypothetical protein HDR63_02090 [bacterium]|nr:hypothetical protein [bacterium]
MKKVIMFLAGLMILLLMFAGLYFAAAVYDAGDRFVVQPFVFQPNNLSTARIGVPASLDQMSDRTLLESLIKKYVVEYFYVTPDLENVARRTRGDGILALMSAPAVFREWKDTVGADIERMAEQDVLRRVTVADEILRPAGSDYWTVVYELKTWRTPNDMAATPTVTRGVIYLRVAFVKELRDQMHGEPFDVRSYLMGGGDPAAIFKFQVAEVAHQS